MGQVGRLGPKVGDHLALLLHSSREPGELSQCSKHDDSTINIVVVIIIIIIIITVAGQECPQEEFPGPPRKIPAWLRLWR